MDTVPTRAGTPPEASFFVALYRAERSAALARGADLTVEHPHDFAPFRHGDPNYTWKPAVKIGADGCYRITPIE